MNDLYTNRTCLPTTTPSDPCTLGEYPAYVIQAQSVLDVQAAVLFASLYNIRLNIKNTGHDFMGRSTAAGSLSVWTHHFDEKTIIRSYSSPSYTGPAVRFGSGVQTGEAYTFLNDYGRVVVGGECQSVGFSGGYLPGGGHGPLATMYGMGSDNVLEFTLVTANGRYVTASETQNQDLFWALRGGGPGTFGVTISVTVKTYPTPKAAGAVVNFGTMSTDKFWAGIDAFHAMTPSFTAQNMYAYYTIGPGSMTMKPLLAPGKTAAQLNIIIAPLIAKWKALGVNYTATVTEYPTFLQAYKNLFDGESTGTQFVSSRLFGKNHIQSNNTAITAALRKLSEGNLYIVSHMVAPGVNGGANNAVNPVWKTAVILPLTSALVTTGQTIESVIADQVQYDDLMKAASPNGGTYLNEVRIGALLLSSFLFSCTRLSFRQTYTILTSKIPFGARTMLVLQQSSRSMTPAAYSGSRRV
jgi:hypothetical protein